jgi:small conductance mechanosensitive channel
MDENAQTQALLEEYIPKIIEFAQGALQCVLILIVGWIVSKWVRRGVHSVLSNRQVDSALTKFLSQMASYFVLAATLIAALGTVGVETTSVVALLGSAGLAVGLALQGNLSHLASGVMILFFRPFTIGDVITTGGHTGTVKDIGLFATIMHTPDGQKVIIPNGAITGSSIVNITTLGTRRAAVGVGVAYGADVAQVQAILQGSATKPSVALSDPAPSVQFVGLGASSLDFNVLVWSKSTDFLALQHQLRTAIYNDLNDAGVEIPFNQIVVHQAPPEG